VPVRDANGDEGCGAEESVEHEPKDGFEPSDRLDHLRVLKHRNREPTMEQITLPPRCEETSSPNRIGSMVMISNG